MIKPELYKEMPPIFLYAIAQTLRLAMWKVTLKACEASQNITIWLTGQSLTSIYNNATHYTFCKIHA